MVALSKSYQSFRCPINIVTARFSYSAEALEKYFFATTDVFMQAPLEIRSSNLVFHLQIVLKIAQVRKQLKRVMSLFFSSFAKGQRTK